MFQPTKYDLSPPLRGLAFGHPIKKTIQVLKIAQNLDLIVHICVSMELEHDFEQILISDCRYFMKRRSSCFVLEVRVRATGGDHNSDFV